MMQGPCVIHAVNYRVMQNMRTADTVKDRMLGLLPVSPVLRSGMLNRNTSLYPWR
jgi:hypothetical protein